jgi:CRP/FNR family transcriptional regulator
MNYLGTEHLYLFFSHYKSNQFKKNEIILNPDEGPEGVYYLKQGHVRMYFVSEKKAEFTVLIYKPGDIFPIRWAVNNVDNIYYFEASNEVEVFCSPKKEFIHHLSQNAQFSREVMSQLSFDFGAVVYRMQHLIFGTPYNRVSSVLLTAAKRFGEIEDEKIIIPFSLPYEQIAASSGIAIDEIKKQLSQLTKEGVIDYREGKISVFDIKHLEKNAYV